MKADKHRIEGRSLKSFSKLINQQNNKLVKDYSRGVGLPRINEASHEDGSSSMS